MSRIGRPVSIARCHKIGDDPTHIALLRGVIVRSCVVSGDRHRPGLVTAVQIAEDARGVFHVAPRVEHGFDGGEMLPMEVLVDLHAADVNENGAALPGALKAF